MGSLFGGSSSSGGTQTQTQNQSTSYDPKYRDYTYDILDRAKTAADTPYKGYDISKMFAGFTPDQQQAFEQIRKNQGRYQGYFDQGLSALDKVYKYDSRAAAQPYLDRAGNAVNPWEAGAGATAQSMRGWNDPRTQASYMDPYAEGAINRAHDISSRNFLEKTMPGITSQFAKGQGALGRGNYNKFLGNTVRDFGGELAGTSATMMDKAYWNAADTFGKDQSRMQTGAGQLGTLSRSNIDSALNIAKTGSDITTGAINNGVNIGNAYSQQANALSNLNLTNTGALMAAGDKQQQQAQLPLTAQYQQWQQEQKWPFEMVNFMNAAQRGLNFGTTQNMQTQTGTTQTGGNTPSVAGSVLGTLGAVNTLGGKGNVGGLQRGYDAIFGPSTATSTLPGGQTYNFPQPEGQPQWQRGGRVPRYYRGGAVSRFARGGPAYGALNSNYAVGGDVPVQRGLRSRSRPSMMGAMGPPGGIGALPAPPAMGGGPFSAQGGFALPKLPMPPALPRGAGIPGPLSAMR